MSINGRHYDWESVKITAPNGVQVDVKSIEYSDSQEHKPVYGAGTKPRGFSRGNYKAEWSLTLLREGYDALVQAAAVAGGGVLRNLPPFPIVVSYANDDKPTVIDTLPACLIDDVSINPEQDQDELTVELSGNCFEAVLWGGVAGA